MQQQRDNSSQSCTKALKQTATSLKWTCPKSIPILFSLCFFLFCHLVDLCVIICCYPLFVFLSLLFLSLRKDSPGSSGDKSVLHTRDSSASVDMNCDHSKDGNAQYLTSGGHFAATSEVWVLFLSLGLFCVCLV